MEKKYIYMPYKSSPEVTPTAIRCRNRCPETSRMSRMSVISWWYPHRVEGGTVWPGVDSRYSCQRTRLVDGGGSIVPAIWFAVSLPLNTPYCRRGLWKPTFAGICWRTRKRGRAHYLIGWRGLQVRLR